MIIITKNLSLYFDKKIIMKYNNEHEIEQFFIPPKETSFVLVILAKKC